MLHNKKPVIKRYHRHDWPMHIKQWQESGLKQVEYCCQNGIDEQLFSKHKAQLLTKGAKTKKFIKIPSPKIIDDQEVHEYEIILPGNIRIRTYNDFNPISLKNLIQTLIEI